MKRFIRRSLAKKIITVIWFISAVLFIPWAYYFRLSHAPNGLINCREFWPSVTADRAFFLGVVTLLVYTTPLLFMAYCYFSIIFRIWMRVHKDESNTDGAPGLEDSKVVKAPGPLYSPTIEAPSDREHETVSETCYCDGPQRSENKSSGNWSSASKFFKM